MHKKIKLLLNELNETRNLFWNISPETGFFLNQLVRIRKPKNVLEIGTSNGVSGIYIAEALSHNAGHLYTIESHKKLRFNLATKNFATSGLTPYITQILGHAPEVIPSTPRTFDIIFLDATKYEHTDYLKSILPRTKKGSIIITDNALSHKKELAPYFKEINRLKNFETHLLPIGSGLLVSTRLS